MKKIFFVLSAFFLLASPVLAGGWDDELYPPPQRLTNDQASMGVEYANDRLAVVNEEQEPGILRKTSGFALGVLNTAQKVVTTPVVSIFGQIFGRDKSAETVTETPRPDTSADESWAKLDLDSVPDFSLKVKAKPVFYSESEKIEGMRLANTTTSEKKGLENRMLKVQILMQEFVSPDEK